MAKLETKYPDNFDQVRLRHIGEQVRARLAANRAVHKVPLATIELFAVGNFMSAAECTKMIEMVDAVAEPSAVFDLAYDSGFRTSYSGNINPHDPFIRTISDRIDDLLGLERIFGETIQGQRYTIGQQFKPHHDWFHPGTSYWEDVMAHGGQRSFTAMVFLNDVEEGGLTHFPEIDTALKPKAGVIALWNNASPDGLTNPKTLHAGCPVTAGKKYVITRWYRARPWQ